MPPAPSAPRRITVAHSPDSDDAFMFFGLAAGQVSAPDLEFVHVLADIQTLNEWALEGRLETTAISLHTYPFVQDRYVLLPHGASMGDGYGPMLVAKGKFSREEILKRKIAVPGTMTSALARARLLNMFEPCPPLKRAVHCPSRRSTQARAYVSRPSLSIDSNNVTLSVGFFHRVKPPMMRSAGRTNCSKATIAATGLPGAPWWAPSIAAPSLSMGFSPWPPFLPWQP